MIRPQLEALRSRARLAARLSLAGACLFASGACRQKGEAPDVSASPAPPAPPSAPTVLEHEPNDVQHPQAIGPRAIVLGQITPGKKGAADDDWYRIDVGSGKLLALRIELTGAEPVAQVTMVQAAPPPPPLGPLDAQLEVDDRDRNRLVLTRATSGEPALLPAVACFESCFVHLWGTAPAAYKLTVIGTPPIDTQELEPNDRAIDATPLSAGKTIQGTISAPDDEDWFRVTAQARAGQFLRVELAGVPGVRPELELRALSDGALLATFRAPAEGEGIFLRDISLSGDIAPPAPPQLRPLALDAGSADSVDAGDAAAERALDGGAANPAAPDKDSKPAPAAANTLSPQAEDALAQAHGQAGSGADRSADAGEPGVSAPNSGANAAAPTALFDGGAAIAASLPAAPGAAPRDGGSSASPSGATEATAATPAVAPVGAAPDAGAPAQLGYYVVVKSSPLTDQKKAPRGANQHAPYTLATALEAGPGDLEAEPNDDPQHATWISSTRTGYLAPAGDSDWYRVRNEGKSVLRAEVSGLTRADVELSIFTAPTHPGEKPVLLAHANEGGVREGELLPAVGIDGDALVLVQCAPRELDGVRVRDCEDRDASYSLSVSLAADDGALEREPNDDPEHAQGVSIPARITGTLWPKRDVDVFRFQLDAPRSLSFRLSAVRGVDTMLTLRELKTNKRGKATSDVIGTADASRGEGPEEIVAVPLKVGAYAIEVSSPRRDGSPTQTYVLQIQ